jgi:hypothetical protein
MLKVNAVAALNGKHRILLRLRRFDLRPPRFLRCTHFRLDGFAKSDCPLPSVLAGAELGATLWSSTLEVSACRASTFSLLVNECLLELKDAVDVSGHAGQELLVVAKVAQARSSTVLIGDHGFHLLEHCL